MNDEELTEALRRVLHRRAAGLRPHPGRPPGPGDMPGPYGSVVPRRSPAAMLLAAAAVAVLVAGGAAVAVSGSHHRVSGTKIATPATGSGPTPTGTGQAVPLTTLAPPPPTTLSPATVPPPVVPARFVPRAVAFPAPATGWVLGQEPCGAAQCPAVVRTTDGGASWQPVTAPAVDLGTSPGNVPVPLGIRFADGHDGWIYTSSHLWSTHDGGTSWQAQPIPGGPGAAMGDLVISGTTAYLAVVRPGAGVGVYSSPAGSDSWTAAPVTPAPGGGPQPRALLAASGQSVWELTDNRTVVSGARNPGGAGWQSWTPPCTRANGDAGLAAASPTDLVALCDEGAWGPPDAGTAAGQTWLYRSSDGGSTFSEVTDVPEGPLGPLAVAPGQPSDILAISQAGILASFNGGLSWAPVYPGYGGDYAAFDSIAYTTATHAVAVFDTAQGTALVISRDGGHTWRPVTF